MRANAVAIDSRKKTVQCRQWQRHHFRICRISFKPGKSRRCFWRRLCAIWAISGSRHQPWSRRRSISCNLVNVNLCKLRNFDRPLGLPDHLQWSFYVSNLSSLRHTTVRMRGNFRCHQPRNNSHDRVDVNRRKSGRYTQYLWNFDGQLWLPGRRRWCFWRQQCVISSKNVGSSPWQLLLLSIVKHVATVSISRKIHNFVYIYIYISFYNNKHNNNAIIFFHHKM